MLFARQSGGRGDQDLGKLVLQPLDKYKRAQEDLSKHEQLKYHIFSVAQANALPAKERNADDIDLQLDQQKKNEDEQYRQNLLQIAKTVILCG